MGVPGDFSDDACSITSKDGDNDQSKAPKEDEVVDIYKEEDAEKKAKKKDSDYTPPGTSTQPQIVDTDLIDDVNLMLNKVNKYTDMLVKALEDSKKKEERRKEKRKKKQAKESTTAKSDQAGPSAKKRKIQAKSDPKKKKSKVAPIKEGEDELINQNFYPGVPHDPEVFDMIDGKRYLNGELVHDEQPDYFCGGVMRDYQIVGFNWLKRMFDNAANGILADEMGLGKTIQCIAMIARLVKVNYPGPFLVCAPLSTIRNWFNEFKRFAPSCPALLYYGANENERKKLIQFFYRSPLQSKTTLITSYEVLMRDRALLSRNEWSYLIVDEGHRLKNPKCRLMAELKRMPLQTKLLLTGTPLQNNLTELWSLLNFMVPEIFSDISIFKSFFDFDKLSEHFGAQHESNFINILHKTLTPFLLRRTKKDVVLSLPNKREVMLYAPSSTDQIEWHSNLGEQCFAWKKKKTKGRKDAHLDLSLLDMKKEDRHGKKSQELPESDDFEYNMTPHNMLMHLRKSCNHPYLLKYPLLPGSDWLLIDEQIVEKSGKMILLDKMLPTLLSKGHKILLFSQMVKMLDILADYLNMRKIKFFRLDGSAKLDDRQSDIDAFNAPDCDTSIFLISTKAGGLGINLTAADTVIIYDSDWNPQNDLQAQDRCHRIGQTRPVVVYRLVLKDTVDEMMVERAQAKRCLSKIIISDKKFKGSIKDDLADNGDDTDIKTLVQNILKKNARDKKDGVVYNLDKKQLKQVVNRRWVMEAALDEPDTTADGNSNNKLYKFVE